jgi:very-short-patch-repair endonuclease
MISHRSAAELLGLLPEAAGDVEVTVPGRNPGRHAGIRVHRVARLAPEDVIVVDGLRVTSVARTICDLAATEPTKDCEAALQEAKYRRLVTDERIAAVLTREPTRRGAPVVQALLRDPRLTRSGGERALLKLIAQAQLPRPETNFRWHGFLLDAYWPDHGLVVEVDGWDAHGHRGAFERDRKRDQVLLAHGLRVLRITGRQLLEEPIAVAARIAAALRG